MFLPSLAVLTCVLSWLTDFPDGQAVILGFALGFVLDDVILRSEILKAQMRTFKPCVHLAVDLLSKCLQVSFLVNLAWITSSSTQRMTK